MIKDLNYTRTSKTGNPTNGGGLCGTRKTREHENHEEAKKEKVAVGLVAARENFEAEVRWFADRRVVSTCQRRDTYRNLDFCLRAKRQDLAFVVIQNA